MNSYENWHDWTHPILPGMQVFDARWHKEVSFESLGSIDSVGRQSTHLHIGTHAGTHIDAPSHFVRNGSSVDELSPSLLLGVAEVVYLKHSRARSAIGLEDLQRSMKAPERIRTRGLILFVGRSHHYGSTGYYADQPYLLPEAADYLVSLGPSFIGYDMAMPDNPLDNRLAENDSPIHRIFLGAGIPLVENLNIQHPPPTEVEHCGLFLPLGGLDGSPVRFLARGNQNDK